VKAVIVRNFTDVRVEDRPVPEIGESEILVRTKVCGICSGDIMPWYIEQKAPLVLGHEPSGVVEGVGCKVKDFKPGDRVFVHHHAPCFECGFCRRGNYSMCPTWKSSHIDPGGMAEFFRVPAENLADTLVLPDSVSFEAGALLEPVACAVKAIRRARITPGDRVLVIGLGVMGLILLKLAKLAGAETVGSDFIFERRQKALDNGADQVIDPVQVDLDKEISRGTGGKADVVIVGPPSLDALKQGLTCVEKGGTLLMFTPTPPGQIWSLEPHYLYFNEISLIPSYSCGPNDTREALDLFVRKALKPEDFVTHRFSLDEGPQAFRAMAAGKEVIKVLVSFDSVT